MQRITLISAALACGLFASPALAAGQVWQVGNNSYNVHVGDLDLATARGRAAALDRVESAAARACGSDGVRSEVLACRAQLVEAASRTGLAAALRQAMSERAAGAVTLAQAR